MATVLNLTRPLSAITLDLATTRQRVDTLLSLPDLSDEEDAACAALDARRFSLEAEFKAEFYRATGVAWDIAERAMS